MDRDKIIHRLLKEGILHTLFKDPEFGKEFMSDYFFTIDQKDFNIFQEKLVNFISEKEEGRDLSDEEIWNGEDLCDERGRPL